METRLHPTEILGVDIGGANLKAATASGKTWSKEFPMWLQHESLGSQLKTLLGKQSFQSEVRVGVTMTGELADCFATRRKGVAAIIDQLESVWDERQLFVYGVDGSWLSSTEARQNPWAVAASNWHAFARWVAGQQWQHFSPEASKSALRLVIDIGSTTTDITPIKKGLVATDSRTDRERIETGQLVYTGFQRTSAAMILSEVSIEQGSETSQVPLMAEHFATSEDAYLLLGEADELPEEAGGGADGGPRTSAGAHRRLARLIGEDEETVGQDVTRQIAQQLVSAQAIQIARAIHHAAKQFQEEVDESLESHQFHILFGGHGWPLMKATQEALTSSSGIQCEILDLRHHIGSELSRIGPAYAVSSLLRDHLVSQLPTKI